MARTRSGTGLANATMTVFYSIPRSESDPVIIRRDRGDRVRIRHGALSHSSTWGQAGTVGDTTFKTAEVLFDDGSRVIVYHGELEDAE